jgi:hypothetical protein
MKFIFTHFTLSLVFIFSASVFAQTQPRKQYSDLSQSMAAFSKIIEANTDLPSKNEVEKSVTPPVEELVKMMSEDTLEKCFSQEISPTKVINFNKNGTESSIKEFHLLIKGPECPYELEAQMKSFETNFNFGGNFSVKIKMQSPDYIQKYKLLYSTTFGRVESTSVSQDNKIKTVTQISLQAEGEGTEIGLFKQSADIGVNFVFDMATFSMNMQMDQKAVIKYLNINDTLTANLNFSGFESGQENYTFNNESISASQFQELTQGFISLGMFEEEDENQSAPNSNTKTECTFLVYDKNIVPVKDLKKLLSSKSTANGFVATQKTCHQPVLKTLSLDGRDSIYIQYQDPDPIVLESDLFSYSLQCQPNPSCL